MATNPRTDKDRLMIRQDVFVIAVLCAGSLSIIPRRADAQSPCAQSKVAFVRGEAILNSDSEYVRADSALQAQNDQYQVEVQKMQATLDSAASAYQNKSTLLTPTAKTAELQKLQDQRTQMNQRVSDLRQKALDQRQQLLQPIETRVQDIIDGMRAEYNCALILDANSQAGVILSADRSLDLTDRVIARLKGSKPAPPAAPAPGTGLKPPSPTPARKP
jgi:Skp family chaperone for outer membrane proteins